MQISNPDVSLNDVSVSYIGPGTRLRNSAKLSVHSASVGKKDSLKNIDQSDEAVGSVLMPELAQVRKRLSNAK